LGEVEAFVICDDAKSLTNVFDSRSKLKKGKKEKNVSIYIF